MPRYETMAKVPDYIFVCKELENVRPCGVCGQSTHCIAHDIHVFVCSPECLQVELKRLIRRLGLKDYVTISLEKQL